MTLGQEHRRLRVLEHVREPGARVAGVHRHVGAAGLEDGQQAHHELEGALHGHADEHVAADAQAAQPVGESVGAGVQLPVRQ